MDASRTSPRLDGLDFARFIAFVGMVIVNFKIAMGADGINQGVLGAFTVALEGRAAATFVVLAGVGMGLAAQRSDYSQTVFITLKRAVFLLILGLLNSLIFDADILHYYAFYFLFGVFCLPFSSRKLIGAIVALNVAFVAMILVLNYDAGWNWDDYTYEGLWTPTGFIRNLFFNGWHPVIPWLSFLLFGILLSRLKLHERALQTRMIIIGVFIFIVNESLSAYLSNFLESNPDELGVLFGTSPVPPMPLYMIAGMSIAVVAMALCLRTSDWLKDHGVLRVVTPAGRQTLTLYIAHIVVGMGTLEALGLLGNQSIPRALIAAFIFCVLATLYALLWSKKFKRGPIETLMRKMAG